MNKEYKLRGHIDCVDKAWTFTTRKNYFYFHFDGYELIVMKGANSKTYLELSYYDRVIVEATYKINGF